MSQKRSTRPKKATRVSTPIKVKKPRTTSSSCSSSQEEAENPYDTEGPLGWNAPNWKGAPKVTISSFLPKELTTSLDVTIDTQDEEEEEEAKVESVDEDSLEEIMERIKNLAIENTVEKERQSHQKEVEEIRRWLKVNEIEPSQIKNTEWRANFLESNLTTSLLSEEELVNLLEEIK
jgi:hypothetical protein